MFTLSWHLFIIFQSCQMTLKLDSLKFWPQHKLSYEMLFTLPVITLFLFTFVILSSTYKQRQNKRFNSLRFRINVSASIIMAFSLNTLPPSQSQSRRMFKRFDSKTPACARKYLLYYLSAISLLNSNQN